MLTSLGGGAVFQRLDPAAKSLAMDACGVPRERRAEVLQGLSIIEAAVRPVLNERN